MGFKDDYPEFAAIERHIHRAHLERSVYLATVFSNVIAKVAGLFSGAAHGKTDHDRKAIEAEALMKRWAPKY